MGFNELISKLFGNKAQRDLKEISPYVEKIKAIYPSVEKLSHDELRARSQAIEQKIADAVSAEKNKIEELRAKAEELELEEREKVWAEVDSIERTILDKQEHVLDEVLPEAFAIVKDTARRFVQDDQIVVTATDFDRQLAVAHDFVSIDGDKAIYVNQWMAGGNLIKWDMIHYDVQLFGGVVLHNHNPKKYEKDTEDPRLSKRVRGYIAEMATGEGKSLVATLPVFLNAMTHRGVHIVTVNDYLSKRDSEWMGPLYMFHGLSVDCIDKHQPNSDSRRKAYEADITFGTNNEFGFDYLRDNMAISPKDLVQRKHNYAIVDEVDSVLIDDARTPLIISGPVPKGEDQLFEEYRSRVENVVNVQRNFTNKLLVEAKQKIASEDSEVQKEGLVLLFRSFKGMPKNKALIKFLSEQGVKAGMLKTEEFYMQQQNKEMHIITDPLYFVIDEKNNTIELTDKGIDLLTGNSDDPLFFVLPDIGNQIAQIENEGGTDEEKQAKKDELMQNYAVKSERVHTVNQLLKAYCLFEKDDEYVVIDNKVKIVDEQTGRIMEGRRYSDGLHQAIEAKERVQVEAATQTFATITLQNYFRMYHKLAGMTGTAETEAGEFWDIYKLDVVVIPTNRPINRDDMNDRIYKTAREKYSAVIEEIVKLRDAGRPVLVGTTSVEISELLSRMLTMRKIQHNVLNAKLHQKEAEIVKQAGQTGTVTIATNMAGRGTDIKLSPEVREAGGLAIIGTERHESRRVDRQLRGRSGRQGDPGSSVFFISLEDELMRLFATERIAGMMDRMGFKEGEVLEHSMLNKSVERAQKKVEENNFGIRKRLLEYDDVMNSQREVIYTRRRHALMGERIGLDVLNMLYDTANAICEQYIDANDYEGLKFELLKTMALEVPFTEDEMKGIKPVVAVDKVFNVTLDSYKRKTDRMAQIANPVIKKVYEEQGDRYENIVVPVTDGKRIYNIQCNLKEACQTESKDVIKSFEKAILLHSIDEAWKEHLREMDELRQSVQNASYENKDPLLIYKLESFELFKKMVDDMNRKSVSVLMRGQIPMREPEEVRQAAPERKTDYSKYRTQKDEISESRRVQGQVASRDTRELQKTAPIRTEKTVGRNDPCPCGSGKKYKNCCGRV
jgi:preprotein translocase subunit SecA